METFDAIDLYVVIIATAYCAFMAWWQCKQPCDEEQS